MATGRQDMDITQLVTEHHQAMYRYAYRLTGSVADAEDLTQQVFLAAQQKLAQLRRVESARTWLFVMLRNAFLKSRQKRRPALAVNLDLNLDNIPAEVPSDEVIDRQQLQEAINALPRVYRVVLLMFYFEDRSYREIADDLGLPIGTVMSRLARAKSHLRARLFPASRIASAAAQPASGGGG